jgi:hypothetical protein
MCPALMGKLTLPEVLANREFPPQQVQGKLLIID